MRTRLAPADVERYARAIVFDALKMKPGDRLFVNCEAEHRELVASLATVCYGSGIDIDVLYDEPRGVTRSSVARARRPARPVHRLEPHPAAGGDRTGRRPLYGSCLQRIPTCCRIRRPTAWLSTRAVATRSCAGSSAPPTAWSRSGASSTSRPTAGRRRRTPISSWTTHTGACSPTLLVRPGRSRRPRGCVGGARGDHRPAGRRARRAPPAFDPLPRLGTDLEIGLIPGARWCAGARESPYGDIVSVNLPTEEVFTSPDRRAASGTFTCSRPLSIYGRVIEGIRGEFAGGRLKRVDCDREEDASYLRELFATRGGDRIGEVALVDASSRIGAAGRVYWSSLLDENAASHFAFGFGFPARCSTRVMPPASGRSTRRHPPRRHDRHTRTGRHRHRRPGRQVPVIRDGSFCIT